ncbi:hypothetical protein ABPG77_002244 [Micractinium sp. CCAP 211/92]
MPALLAACALPARPACTMTRPHVRVPPPAAAARWIRAAAVAAAVAAAGASRTAAASAADHEEGSLAVCQLVGGKWEFLWALPRPDASAAPDRSPSLPAAQLPKTLVRRQDAPAPAAPLPASGEAVAPPAPAVQTPKRSLLDSLREILVKRLFSWQGRLIFACCFLMHAASLYHVGHLG